MLFTDLQTSIRARLMSDAYFAETVKPVSVLIENQMDLTSELDKSLGSLGAYVVVRTLGLKKGEGRAVYVPIVIEVGEFVELNRADSGSGKPGSDLCTKALSLFLFNESDGSRDWSPDTTLWTPLEFQRMDFVGVSDQGLEVWELELWTYTLLEVVL